MQNLLIFILAAGKGSRMKRAMPKVLHPIGNLPMLGHVLKLADGLVTQPTYAQNNHIGLVVSPDNCDAIQARFPDIPIHIQHQQSGTGDAVKAALADYATNHNTQNNADNGIVLVLYGDTPFISQKTAQSLITAAQQSASQESGALAVLGFNTANPANYGRIVADGDIISKIIEAKELTPAQRKITLCNAGVMAINLAHIHQWLDGISNQNASGEYYLTDLVAAATETGAQIPLIIADEAQVMGVNSLAELAIAEQYWQQQKRENLMAQGVMMQAPETVFFSHDTDIATDVRLDPHLYFGEKVSIASGAHIKSFCHIEGAAIGENASIGPFARLRPKTQLDDNVKIGNFVEVKNSHLKNGVKAGHLSYLGDAEIGADSNIGAGTITCNYDGFAKHKTILGENVFVGSNSALIAPVTIGDNALIGAGSVIAKNVENDALALTRAPQKNIGKQGMNSKSNKQTKD
ncbi:MAG: bifunctional UDP-N-acetylglucosamine diphosphorylase/glucosamine-1-phosphate N-acetyltransferase GlmU [Alphaproteobacteria bacterium]|nr:bifunctional UDP-N-acetylglucosamine diphosphorylase/glucosamine-1-phosphate N-acetyltransferase GlmU [Alphaproteobacteria bacterium]